MQRRGLYFCFCNRWVLVTFYRKPFRVEFKNWPAQHPMWYAELTPWERMDG